MATPTKRAPLPRKRSAPRRYRTPRCEVRGCKKPQDVKWTGHHPECRLRAHGENFAGSFICVMECLRESHGFCRPHAKAEADRRFAAFIRDRDGFCRLTTSKPCSGPLQCCHLLSRRFLATRYDEDNAVGGCRTHHAYWSANPDRWAERLDRMLGPRTLDRLRRQAFGGPAPDLAEVLGRYPA